MGNTKHLHISQKLTIVIPTYNEDKYIESTIISIANQTNIIGTRVIISDGFSTDKTRDIVNNLKERFKEIINIELIDGGKVATGRNNGAIICNTKYILFLDGDSPLQHKDNISHNLYIMYHNKLDLLTCKIKSVGKDIRTNISFRIFNLLNYFISHKTPFAVGGYFLTRADKFMEYGMFDEALNNSEDYHLSKKYNPNKFQISPMKYGQDDRRFKKMGYVGMLKFMILNYFNRNKIEWFKNDIGYWDD